MFELVAVVVGLGASAYVCAVSIWYLRKSDADLARVQQSLKIRAEVASVANVYNSRSLVVAKKENVEVVLDAGEELAEQLLRPSAN